MLLTAHGPRATIAERLAARNIKALTTPDHIAWYAKLEAFIDLHCPAAEGWKLVDRIRIGEAIIGVCQDYHKRRRITSCQLSALRDRVASRLK